MSLMPLQSQPIPRHDPARAVDGAAQSVHWHLVIPFEADGARQSVHEVIVGSFESAAEQCFIDDVYPFEG